MPKILGLDPGVTTGWAIVEYADDAQPVLLHNGQIADGHKGFINYWDELPSFDFVVCESFTLREGIRGVNIEPAYVIGALEAIKPAEIHYQTPALKSLCDNDALKRLNMYVRGQQHARDAIRHAIVFLKKNYHLPTLTLGWMYDENEDR